MYIKFVIKQEYINWRTWEMRQLFNIPRNQIWYRMWKSHENFTLPFTISLWKSFQITFKISYTKLMFRQSFRFRIQICIEDYIEFHPHSKCAITVYVANVTQFKNNFDFVRNLHRFAEMSQKNIYVKIFMWKLLKST